MVFPYFIHRGVAAVACVLMLRSLARKNKKSFLVIVAVTTSNRKRHTCVVLVEVYPGEDLTACVQYSIGTCKAALLRQQETQVIFWSRLCFDKKRDTNVEDVPGQ